LMKVILSGLDEGYSERTWWRLFWAHLMKVILSALDEGYSECHLMKVILSVLDEGYSERTWWRLFQKLVVRTNFYIYVFIIFEYFIGVKSHLVGKAYSNTPKNRKKTHPKCSNLEANLEKVI
jgi:hypothetical protein